MPEIYPVGMAEMRIARSPDILATYGIGSCVIVAMYDPKTKIGGVAHIMLPDSTGIAQERLNPRKFADTAVPLLFQTLSHAGCFKSRVISKIVGGAEMFPPNENLTSNIGTLNTCSAIEALKKLRIPILAKDIGGRSGRSIEMNLDTGRISVTILGESPKEI